MSLNADFLLKKFDRFMWIASLNKRNEVSKWRRRGYSPQMKRRLTSFVPAILKIPFGCPIFTISDFRFAVGTSSVVATNVKDISFRSQFVYFTVKDVKTLEGLNNAFGSLFHNFLQIDRVRTKQVREKGLHFIMPLENLILFCYRIETYRPEVAMALRRAYFDRESNPQCAMALRISAIGRSANGKGKVSKTDSDILKTMLGPIIKYKTPRQGYSLRPYQLVGIAFWRASNGRAMIGDQMGIGKTAQAIGTIKLAMLDKTIASPFPVLVVCPKSGIGQWQEAIEEWMPGLKTTVMIGGVKPSIPEKSVLITTYESMRRNSKWLKSRGFRYVIFDESHRLKNAHSGRTKEGTDLALSVPFVLLLTGTPMEKGVSDLWAQFHIIAPMRFPNPKIFLESLESYDLKGKTWPLFYPVETTMVGDASSLFSRYRIDEFVGKKDQLVMRPRTEEKGKEKKTLRQSFQCYMIRRLKNEVLNLPPKTRVIIRTPLDATGKKLYKSYEKQAAQRIKKIRIRHYIKFVVRRTKQLLNDGLSKRKAIAKAKVDGKPLLEKTNAGMDAMLAFTDLKRQVGMLKTAMVIQKLKDFFRDTAGKEPILVFAEQHRVIDEIAKKMSLVRKKNGKNVVVRTYTGRIGSKEREKIKKDFQDGKVDLLILNKAGNVGLNLQRASYVLFAERYWNPTDEEQGEDRAHRLGTKKPVTIFYIMVPDTIEDKILQTIDRKRDAIMQAVGNQAYATSVRQQKVQAKELLQQLQNHFDQFIGRVIVPDREIKKALHQAGI